MHQLLGYEAATTRRAEELSRALTNDTTTTSQEEGVESAEESPQGEPQTETSSQDAKAPSYANVARRRVSWSKPLYKVSNNKTPNQRSA